MGVVRRRGDADASCQAFAVLIDILPTVASYATSFRWALPFFLREAA